MIVLKSVALIVLLCAVIAPGVEGKPMSENDRWADVTRDPSSMRFVALWADEKDNHEESPEFETVDEAVAWARAHASTVHVVLGFARPQVFSAGERYDAGEDPINDPLPQWPPPPEVREQLLADQYVPTRDWSSAEVIEEEADGDR